MYVAVYQLITLLGFMDAVESVSIPKSDTPTLRVLHKLSEHTSRFWKTALQVGHLFSGAVDFKEGIFSFPCLIFL